MRAEPLVGRAMRVYRYVGPVAVEMGRGASVTDSLATLRRWLGENPDATHVGATFVVDTAGALRLAPRRSEHVACAAGGDVRTAGEITFREARGRIVVASSSNQSTGYCPEPSSFAALAEALAKLGLEAPRGFDFECEFRRCDVCGQINLVKEGELVCAACDAPLAKEWNVDLGSAG